MGRTTLNYLAWVPTSHHLVPRQGKREIHFLVIAWVHPAHVGINDLNCITYGMTQTIFASFIGSYPQLLLPRIW